MKMGVLAKLLVDEDAAGNLDEAALEVAAIQFPEIEARPHLETLDALARELGGRIGDLTNGQAYVAAARRYLFDELGFRGNEADYYDPLNSCLNQVLERRRGIPITLSVVYMEIGRRLARPVFGVGLPRHFIVEYNDGRFQAYIDPFHGGLLLEPADCYELAGAPVADPALLRRATKRQILVRMLQNLRGIYLRSQDFARATEVLNWLIQAGLGAAEALKQRAVVHLEQRRFAAAKRDLEEYLALEPAAEDRAAVLEQIEAIHRWLAAVN